MEPAKNLEKPYGTVLVKARDILDYLLNESAPPTLSDISRALHSAKPTVCKTLATLESLGFVWRDDSSKRYFLGMHLVPYAQKALASFDIVKLSRQFLEKLRDMTQETINLGIVRDDMIVLVEKLESPRSIKLQSTIGGTMNMYSSAMGKSILATYSQEKLDDYFNNHKLKALTFNTITTPVKLRRDLDSVRKIGVAVDNEENQEEVFCLAASLRREGQLYGAFSISIPKYRISEDTRTSSVRLLLDTKHAIERAI